MLTFNHLSQFQNCWMVGSPTTSRATFFQISFHKIKPYKNSLYCNRRNDTATKADLSILMTLIILFLILWALKHWFKTFSLKFDVLHFTAEISRLWAYFPSTQGNIWRTKCHLTADFCEFNHPGLDWVCAL